ncbi:GntR family transcriptional regulator [Streptomyces hygroscopicus]|uniref:GntR family transcriptional regulator n=1 Tax=Streptomyces hygroscopicus TaxID=1912 RepID=UPI001FCAB19A|nr:GntR family transcriptional regulator [Streptomyces hygroscopicus]BDH15337.1 hypothetical protein HOK021_65160 [Streptomyces hygroscopicus]
MTTDDAAALTPDPRQLRDDLLVLRRVSGNSMQAAPASVARNVDMARRIARHWAPFGHTRRAAANGSAAEERRWDILLARATPERSVKCYADVVVYASAVAKLVQALHDAARPGTAVPEVARAITAAISKGDFPVGFELRVKQVAAGLRAPVELVRAAVSSLVDSNVLERRSRRIFPAGSLEMHDALATHIADRLRAQIAAGVYARGSRLPSAKFLATTVCSDSAPVGRALRILDAEGTVHIGPRGSEVAQSARLLPHPAPTAPHHDDKNPRFSRDTIVATCRAAHEQWRRRGPAPAEVLHERGGTCSPWPASCWRRSRTRPLTPRRSGPPLPGPQSLRPPLCRTSPGSSSGTPPAWPRPPATSFRWSRRNPGDNRREPARPRCQGGSSRSHSPAVRAQTPPARYGVRPHHSLKGTPVTTDRYTAATATRARYELTQIETVLARLAPRALRSQNTDSELQALREAQLTSAVSRTPRPRIGIYTMVQPHQDPAVRLAVVRGLAVRNGWLLERAPAVDFTGMTCPVTRPQLARLLDDLDHDDIDGIAAMSRTDFSDCNGDYEDALQRIHARRGFLALATTETDI